MRRTITAPSQYIEYFAHDQGQPVVARAPARNASRRCSTRRKPSSTRQALAASGDEAAKLWHQAGEEMIKDRIILPLVSPNLILAYKSDVKGVRYSACCNLPLAEISH